MVHLATNRGPAVEHSRCRGWRTARMSRFLTSLHFLHPAWLLALPPLLLLTAWLARSIANDGNWSRIVDAQLLPLLRISEGRRARSVWPLLIGYMDIGSCGSRRASLDSHQEPGIPCS